MSGLDPSRDAAAHQHHGITTVTRVRSGSRFGAHLLGGPCGTLDEAMARYGVHGRSQPACHNGSLPGIKFGDSLSQLIHTVDKDNQKVKGKVNAIR